MIRLIDLTKLFGLIFVLTFGGPGGATETVAFNTYLVGFKDFRMSYAAALSYVIVGGVLVLTLALPCGPADARDAGGLMAIALDRPRVAVRSARLLRVRRWVGIALTWATLIAALVFFLGPFFWILTTSLKGNEDFFAFPPVWMPADASLAHYAGLFTRSSGRGTSPTA